MFVPFIEIKRDGLDVSTKIRISTNHVSMLSEVDETQTIVFLESCGGNLPHIVFVKGDIQEVAAKLCGHLGPVDHQ